MAGAATALLHARLTSGLSASTARSEASPRGSKGACKSSLPTFSFSRPSQSATAPDFQRSMLRSQPMAFGQGGNENPPVTSTGCR
jgi:hypothetical protein